MANGNRVKVEAVVLAAAVLNVMMDLPTPVELQLKQFHQEQMLHTVSQAARLQVQIIIQELAGEAQDKWEHRLPQRPHQAEVVMVQTSSLLG